MLSSSSTVAYTGKSKSAVNRERFLRRYKAQIQRGGQAR